jgi:hypothetical protein
MTEPVSRKPIVAPSEDWFLHSCDLIGRLGIVVTLSILSLGLVVTWASAEGRSRWFSLAVPGAVVGIVSPRWWVRLMALALRFGVAWLP